MILTADPFDRLLWHDIVATRDSPDATALVHFLVSLEPSLTTVVDFNSKRTAYDEATLEMKRKMDDVTCFCGRLYIKSVTPLHGSGTCIVLVAIDRLDGNRPVVLKLMLHADQFEREKRARDGLDSKFVVPILLASDGEGAIEEIKDEKEAEAQNLPEEVMNEFGKYCGETGIEIESEEQGLEEFNRLLNTQAPNPNKSSAPHAGEWLNLSEVNRV